MVTRIKHKERVMKLALQADEKLPEEKRKCIYEVNRAQSAMVMNCKVKGSDLVRESIALASIPPMHFQVARNAQYICHLSK